MNQFERRMHAFADLCFFESLHAKRIPTLTVKCKTISITPRNSKCGKDHSPQKNKEELPNLSLTDSKNVHTDSTSTQS